MRSTLDRTEAQDKRLRQHLERLLRANLLRTKDLGLLDGESLRILRTLDIQNWKFAIVACPFSAANRLSRRQHEVAVLLGQGLGNRGIARQLGVSPETVANHVKAINRKLGTSSRAAIARYAAVCLTEGT